MIRMYDTVDVFTVPPNPEAVAGYVGGYWPTYEPLVQRFPHAHHLSIAINSDERARALDIERGDASPDEAGFWLDNRALADPVLYCAASDLDAVIAARGRRKALLWSAHYGHGRHVCGPNTCGYPQADGTQWTDVALGRNLDESWVSDVFFPHPRPVDPWHYDRYPTGPFQFGRHWLNERATVKEFDRLIAHPKRNRQRIAFLRGHIRLLRDRLWTVAHWDSPPSWDHYYRGWRWQKLNQRLHGRANRG